MIIFDIETDGLLKTCTKIHSLVMYDTCSNELLSCADQPNYMSIREGLSFLQKAETICGHNILWFDIPAITKIFPEVAFTNYKIDTLVMSRMLYPSIIDIDMGLSRSGKIPSKLIGNHTLESWGYRLDFLKGEFGKTTDWSQWSSEMQDYCEQDVKLNVKIWEKFKQKNIPEKSMKIEMAFAEIMARQEIIGSHFNTEAAIKLKEELEKEKLILEKKLIEIVPPEIKREEFIPKRNNGPKGWIAGEVYIREKKIPFNPNSRTQCISFLKRKYDWKPEVFTDKNGIQLDADVLESLPYPEAELMAEFYKYNGLLSKIYSGKGAWLKFVENDRIHGRVKTPGTVSGRVSHSSPNLGNIPSVRAFKGKESRALFNAPEGMVMVGCDASGIQLRILAHYLYPFDGGEYIELVTKGDVHTKNQNAGEISTRDRAKTFIYAFLFGAGDQKLGSIDHPKESSYIQKLKGKDMRRKFTTKMPAVKNLVLQVSGKFKLTKELKALAGHTIYPRSAHSALVTLIQGAEASIMKNATVKAFNLFAKKGLIVEPSFFNHDELQCVTLPESANEVGEIVRHCIIESGVELGLRCPLDAEYKIGKNWAETH